jgi:hypothetical protein
VSDKKKSESVSSIRAEDTKDTKDAKALVVEPDKTIGPTTDYGEDVGAGYEHQDAADTSIPFMVQLQALSPIVAEGRADARPGDWYNTITERVYKKEQGFLFVPATTRRKFGKWTPRPGSEAASYVKGGGDGERGGFHGNLEPDDPAVLKAIADAPRFGMNMTPDGKRLVECFYVYGVVCGESGEAETMAAIPFSSAKIKSYKSWMTRLQQVFVRVGDKRPRPPLYAHLTRVGSLQQKNDKGVFFVPLISSGDKRGMNESLMKPDDERFLMAKACRQLVDSGEVKVDYSKQGAAGEEDGGGEGTPNAFA